MLSNNTAIVVDYYRVWSRLPNLVNITHTKPVSPVQKEEYVVEYTEDQLRNLVINRLNLFGGMVIDPAMIRSLPNDYLTDLYNSVRYMKQTTVTMPIRLNDSYNPSSYLLPNYILMSVLLSAIYDIESNTTDPFKQWRANNIVRLLKQIHYVLIDIIKRNPSGTKPAGTVVACYVEETGTGDELSTENFVFIDSASLAALQANGWTAQSVADHWVENKTQPQ